MTRLAAAFLLAFPFPLVASALPDITPIAEAQRGTMVTVQGTVERITDEDEFRLTDATGSILVYVGPNLVPADVDEAITVSGFVDDDDRPEGNLCARTDPGRRQRGHLPPFLLVTLRR
jgi:hypothetical protein